MGELMRCGYCGARGIHACKWADLTAAIEAWRAVPEEDRSYVRAELDRDARYFEITAGEIPDSMRVAMRRRAAAYRALLALLDAIEGDGT